MSANRSSSSPSAPSGDLTQAQAKAARTRRLLLFLAFFALSANLRAPLTSLPPVISLLQHDLGVSQGIAGLFTTIPVLCFGLAAPLAAYIQGRLGIERTIFATLWGIVLGTIVRSLDGTGLVLTGTLIIGMALTLGNIVSLVVIARDFYDRRASMTGVLVSAMSVGAMVTSAFTAPMATGVGWRFGLAVWSAMAVLAIVLWHVTIRLNAPHTRSVSPSARGSLTKDVAPKTSEQQTAIPAPDPAMVKPAAAPALLRRPIAWMLAIPFACHTFMFYGLTAWLPDYLHNSAGISLTNAGVAESMFQIVGMIGCFGVPWLSTTFRLHNKILFLGVTVAWFIVVLGVYLSPHLWPLWMLFGGFGGGGGFVVVFTLIMDHAISLRDNRRLTSFVQGLGYTVASTSPAVLGTLHQWSGRWRLAFLVLTMAAVMMTVTGYVASIIKPAKSAP